MATLESRVAGMMRCIVVLTLAASAATSSPTAVALRAGEHGVGLALSKADQLHCEV